MVVYMCSPQFFNENQSNSIHVIIRCKYHTINKENASTISDNFAWRIVNCNVGNCKSINDSSAAKEA